MRRREGVTVYSTVSKIKGERKGLTVKSAITTVYYSRRRCFKDS